ncbi:hypothetical protein OJF2_28270 [Aquisphaera giovannonii]|uniref:Uncharacterized protein n=1 Tax=Aquisphaera giovannonii TaxID=406548 RepID=A0A5B9W0X0_9BACT|nr:hypothetical protein [Aquisphaera giovannonii]QEH34292.1 hypothetical protein OJF2_28270 [Aquisphaera giovannonii]
MNRLRQAFRELATDLRAMLAGIVAIAVWIWAVDYIRHLYAAEPPSSGNLHRLVRWLASWIGC